MYIARKTLSNDKTFSQFRFGIFGFLVFALALWVEYGVWKLSEKKDKLVFKLSALKVMSVIPQQNRPRLYLEEELAYVLINGTYYMLYVDKFKKLYKPSKKTKCTIRDYFWEHFCIDLESIMIGRHGKPPIRISLI